jgi:hypothetical protein
VLTSPTNSDDVIRDVPSDKTGPIIGLTEKQFTSSTKSVEIKATIDDPSGVRTALVGTAKMNKADKYWSTKIAVSRDYEVHETILQATDGKGNTTKQQVWYRRVPQCGPEDGITIPLAKQIQTDLTKLGHSTNGIDGLIGKGSCSAIRGYLKGQLPKSWERLAYQLGVDRIELRIINASQSLQANHKLQVKITDPRKTNAVSSIREYRNNAQHSSKPYQNQELPYVYSLAQGENMKLTFEALDRRGNIIDRKTTALSRNKPMILSVLGMDATGQIETTNDSVTLTTDIIDAWPGAQIAVKGDFNNGPVTYNNKQIPFTLPSPAPGSRATAVFTLLDKAGKSHQRTAISIVRLPNMELFLSGKDLAGTRVDTNADSVVIVADLKNGWPGASISYRGSGGVGETRPYSNEPQSFIIPMPQSGNSESIVFSVLYKDDAPRAQTQITLYRSQNMQLVLSARGLSGQQIESTADTIKITADILNAWPGASVRLTNMLGAQSEKPFTGNPLSFDVDMPARGENALVTLTILDKEQKTQDAAKVQLRRTPLELLVTPDTLLETEADTGTITVALRGEEPGTRIEITDASNALIVASDYQANVQWSAKIPMPADGQQQITVSALNLSNETLAQRQISLSRRATASPDWVWPAVIALGALLLAGVGVMRMMRSPASSSVPTPPPPVRVKPVSDPTPEYSTDPHWIPEVIFRVEPSPKLEITINFEEESDPSS